MVVRSVLLGLVVGVKLCSFLVSLSSVSHSNRQPLSLGRERPDPVPQPPSPLRERDVPMPRFRAWLRLQPDLHHRRLLAASSRRCGTPLRLPWLQTPVYCGCQLRPAGVSSWPGSHDDRAPALLLCCRCPGFVLSFVHDVPSRAMLQKVLSINIFPKLSRPFYHFDPVTLVTFLFVLRKNIFILPKIFVILYENLFIFYDRENILFNFFHLSDKKKFFLWRVWIRFYCHLSLLLQLFFATFFHIFLLSMLFFFFISTPCYLLIIIFYSNVFFKYECSNLCVFLVYVLIFHKKTLNNWILLFIKPCCFLHFLFFLWKLFSCCFHVFCFCFLQCFQTLWAQYFLFF